jgi:hypothetical protein
MNCSQLCVCFERLYPTESPQEIARMALLLLNRIGKTDELIDAATVERQWRNVKAAIDATADQHDAMTCELESLCGGDTPVRFHPDQVWTLMRAIKVQNQMLDLYLPVTVDSNG